MGGCLAQEEGDAVGAEGSYWRMLMRGGGMTQYREVMGRKEVEREVAMFTMVDMDKMVEMVRVVAVRESWIMGEFSVVIDRMEDDDWSVGEVELVVKSEEEVEMARRKVQKAVT